MQTIIKHSIFKQGMFFLFAVFIAAGCSRQYPLNGRVTYSDDGSPLEKGVVCFETETFMARGEIGSGGQYTVGSYKRTDGIPQGTYSVYVSGTEEGNSLLIDKKFASPQTSGLSFIVDAHGKNRRFDFSVERAVPKKRNSNTKKLPASNESEDESR